MIEKILLGIGAAIALYLINNALFVMLIAAGVLYGLLKFSEFISSD